MYTEATEDHFNHDPQQYLANEHGRGQVVQFPVQYNIDVQLAQSRLMTSAKKQNRTEIAPASIARTVPCNVKLSESKSRLSGSFQLSKFQLAT